MNNLLQWLRMHKFEAHTLAFLLMILPPIPMFLAAQTDAKYWIWILLSIVIVGNLLELVIE